MCRQYARFQLGIEPAEAANQSAVASGAIGTVAGAAAGALIGAAVAIPGLAQPFEPAMTSSWEVRVACRPVAPPRRFCSPGMIWHMSILCALKGISTQRDRSPIRAGYPPPTAPRAPATPASRGCSPTALMDSRSLWPWPPRVCPGAYPMAIAGSGLVVSICAMIEQHRRVPSGEHLQGRRRP